MYHTLYLIRNFVLVPCFVLYHLEIHLLLLVFVCHCRFPLFGSLLQIRLQKQHC